eukprot:m.82555 g.82555  ORF g.82555 m.82555 type:complete len:81 (+) comp25527_c1_seq1:747-989(+)
MLLISSAFSLPLTNRSNAYESSTSFQGFFGSPYRMPCLCLRQNNQNRTREILTQTHDPTVLLLPKPVSRENHIEWWGKLR